MYKLGAWAEWRIRRRAVSSYLDSDTRKDKDCLLEPTHLYCITGYIMEDALGAKALKNLPQKR